MSCKTTTSLQLKNTADCNSCGLSHRIRHVKFVSGCHIAKERPLIGLSYHGWILNEAIKLKRSTSLAVSANESYEEKKACMIMRRL